MEFRQGENHGEDREASGLEFIKAKGEVGVPWVKVQVVFTTTTLPLLHDSILRSVSILKGGA